MPGTDGETQVHGQGVFTRREPVEAGKGTEMGVLDARTVVGMKGGEDDLSEYARTHWQNLEGSPYLPRRREVGTVVGTREDLAVVSLARGRYCEGCGSCCVAAGEASMLAEARNPVGARVGDRVEVEIPVKAALKAAYLLYGIPLLVFLLGLGAGGALGNALAGGRFGVPLGLASGFALLALSYMMLARIYSPRSRASSAYRPSITRIVERAARRDDPPGSPSQG